MLCARAAKRKGIHPEATASCGYPWPDTPPPALKGKPGGRAAAHLRLRPQVVERLNSLGHNEAKSRRKRPGVSPPEFLGRESGCYLFVMQELAKRGVVFPETVTQKKGKRPRRSPLSQAHCTRLQSPFTGEHCMHSEALSFPSTGRRTMRTEVRPPSCQGRFSPWPQALPGGHHEAGFSVLRPRTRRFPARAAAREGRTAGLAARPRQDGGDLPSPGVQSSHNPQHGGRMERGARGSVLEGTVSRQAAAVAIATAVGAHSVFVPRLAFFRLEAERAPEAPLPFSRFPAVLSRWRDALLTFCNGAGEGVRRLMSGHEPDGSPSGEPHLAFLPLPGPNPRGGVPALFGAALALPRAAGPEETAEIRRILLSLRQLKLGAHGVWNVLPLPASALPRSLCPQGWTATPGGATHWATVTPVAFDRHPKAKVAARYHQATAAMIAGACTRIGLPEPREVVVTRVSAHPGIPPSFDFPLLTRKNGGERRHSHAILVFDQPVLGPILLGAGRFRGYGVCRAMEKF